MNREKELIEFLLQESHEAAIRDWERAKRALDLEERRILAIHDPGLREKIDDIDTFGNEPWLWPEAEKAPEPKVKLSVISDYRNRDLVYHAGQVIEVDQAMADFLQNDAPGCFELSKSGDR